MPKKHDGLRESLPYDNVDDDAKNSRGRRLSSSYRAGRYRDALGGRGDEDESGIPASGAIAGRQFLALCCLPEPGSSVYFALPALGGPPLNSSPECHYALNDNHYKPEDQSGYRTPRRLWNPPICPRCRNRCSRASEKHNRT